MNIRTNRTFTGAWFLISAMVLALFFGSGCESNESLREVRIASTGHPESTVSADNFVGLPAMMCAASPEALSHQRFYVQYLSPGDIVVVGFGASDKPTFNFFYIYRGTEQQPLEFCFDGPIGTLGGKPVAIDLGKPDAAKWLDSQPASQLKGIQTIALSDNVDLDIHALRLLNGTGPLVIMPNSLPLEHQQQLLEAIVDSRPSGLVGDAEIVLPYLPRMTNLQHVLLSKAKPADARTLAALPSLRFLGINFSQANSTSTKPTTPTTSSQPADVSLDEVANLQHIHSLRLVGCDDVSDFRPLGRMHNLRSLALDGCKQLHNPRPLSSLVELESLVLGANSLESLDGIESLKNLKVLFIEPSANASLTPLTHLTKLKMLVVDKDTFKNRQSELDAVRRAAPGVQIVGFCMGSAWILLVVSAGVIGGLILRRRRRAIHG